MNQKLNKKTLEKRLQMAESFYKKHLEGGITSNIKQTQELLLNAAPNYRKSSWLNLRAALVTFWRVNGETETAKQISKVKYPTTLKNKPRPKRCRRVTDDEFKAMMATCKTTKNHIALSILLIAQHTGCRPSEMNSIQHIGDGQFLITSSKKTTERGLDRLLQITDNTLADNLAWAVDIVKGIATRTLQNHFEYLAEKTFPKRMLRPTIYSFRHQLGSNLKASGLSREIIAYMMGHQSTQSVETYGDRRSGRGSTITVRPAIHDAEILKLVRKRHQLPPSHAANDEASDDQSEGVTPHA